MRTTAQRLVPMKRYLLPAILVVATLFVSSCRSPKGNVNYMQMGKGRPNLVQ
ncbi:hypothetical protein BGE01nite_10420 [Brevifollis gellanilyticus]|uniref:Uncharacterized protein n=1 Tax=Brevifollis gellanilyticus TaxID=748831 RepID=A0A512M5X4_9BACT|nr:hypothetical protein BGE01nite_10420 [Brevifollis gellanilyticus]